MEVHDVRLVTFEPRAAAPPRLGALRDGEVVDLAAAGEALDTTAHPATADLVTLLAAGDEGLALAERLLTSAGAAGELRGPDGDPAVRPLDEVRLLAPVPRPRRMRDYLTYSQHATGAGLQLPPAFAAMPVCYQCNVETVIGPDDTIVWPAYTDQLDFELEVGFFVGRGGRNISVADAHAHIAGVTLFNDVSARDIQFFEMSMTIGPSKGKDFCNVLGPAVLTMDEVDEYAIELTARVNGEVWASGTTEHRRYSFAEVLAWASYGEDVYPGEFIAVGTVGGGCGAELDRWIAPGDVVELEASGIGILRNRVGEPEHAPGAGLPTYTGAERFRPPTPEEETDS